VPKRIVSALISSSPRPALDQAAGCWQTRSIAGPSIEPHARVIDQEADAAGADCHVIEQPERTLGSTEQLSKMFDRSGGNKKPFEPNENALSDLRPKLVEPGRCRQGAAASPRFVGDSPVRLKCLRPRAREKAPAFAEASQLI
jgi:hypothetical protein